MLATTEAPVQQEHPPKRLLRVTKLLAQAHQIQREIDRGELIDLTDAARRYDMSRPRITQIMNLLLLAPDIQELILFTAADSGRDHLHEPGFRRLSQLEEWSLQRVALLTYGMRGIAGEGRAENTHA